MHLRTQFLLIFERSGNFNMCECVLLADEYALAATQAIDKASSYYAVVDSLRVLIDLAQAFAKNCTAVPATAVPADVE